MKYVYLPIGRLLLRRCLADDLHQNPAQNAIAPIQNSKSKFDFESNLKSHGTKHICTANLK